MLDDVVALFLVFKGAFLKEHSYCYSIQGLYQFTFSSTMEEGTLFSTPSPVFIVCEFFDDAHSEQYEVAPHCNFYLYFSNN